MTETQERKSVMWESITPTFSTRLREPKRPSDGAIAMAQRSYDGKVNADGETEHALTHRFRTEEEAQLAADELKAAGPFTKPETSVTVLIDPHGTGDKRVVRWLAGMRRGRKPA